MNNGINMPLIWADIKGRVRKKKGWEQGRRMEIKDKDREGYKIIKESSDLDCLHLICSWKDRSVVATTYHKEQMITQDSKSLKVDIKWEIHKRTQQGVSAKLESYLYYYMLVCATNNYACPHVHAISLCSSHFLLKATMCTSCALMSSSRSFYHLLGLWRHIMWPIMWI